MRGVLIPVGPETNTQNVLRFATGEEMNELAQRMKERLSDPEQRAILRIEQRDSLLSQHAAVGRVVGLDPVVEQKLIEILTDQQMERLDQMYLRRADMTDQQKMADEITQRMNALRELLGEEKLERFQLFELSQSARHWVQQLIARLAPEDRLQPDQEDRLVELKQEQFQVASGALAPSRTFRRPVGPSGSLEEAMLDAQRQGLRANENAWRRRQVENRVLEQKAAAFLTPAQLATLTQYHAQEQDNVRRYVESARAQAGMDPQIPEQPEPEEARPQVVEGLLQVDVRLTVNGELMTVTRTVRSGEPFTFEAAQGLIVDALPRLYEDNYIDVHLMYYEQTASGRRRLAGGNISTILAGQSDGFTGGSSGTVISGRKGYAIESSVNAKVL